MRKTDMAWGLSLGFCSKGTFESFKNENSCLAGGAISKILTCHNKLYKNNVVLNNSVYITTSLNDFFSSSRNKPRVEKVNNKWN